MTKSDSNIKASVRSSQLVTTYGVGSMIAGPTGESFIVTGIDRWPDYGETVLHEPRLEKQLGVREFRSPPARGGDEWDVPVRPFPQYQSCSQCHRLNELRYFKSPFGKAVCGHCADEPALVPSRFVAACENGHLDEFPYYQWAHSEQDHSGESARLSLVTRGQSSGLRDIVVKCSCGASRSMDGAFRKNSLRGVRWCQGGRPWLNRDDSEECTLVPTVLQRGATNVWFSDAVSAISIPPWSQGAFRILDRHWTVLAVVPIEVLSVTIEALNISDEHHPLEDLVGAAQLRRAQEAGETGDEDGDMRAAEYDALVRGAPEKDNHDEFVCLPADDPGELASAYFPLINKVTRLREVRVLRGFSRISPASGNDQDDAADDAKPRSKIVRLESDQVGWLPAIEVSGEGVFMELTGATDAGRRLYDWEERADVRERVARLERNAESSYLELEVSPRIVLVHTLAHALIDQWALESGYPAASLRERLYVNEARAGVLIYTASTDSAGSLGGVVSMTDGGRLSTSLVEAMRRASWCSGDPLCVETTTQGPESLNLAACHACVLLPETSCEQRNLLLDRALLIGTPDNPSLGYFSELLG